MVQPPLFVKNQPVIVPDLLEKIVIFFHPHCGFQFLDDFNDIENAPAEAGAKMELHHRVFQKVFNIAAKHTG